MCIYACKYIYTLLIHMCVHVRVHICDYILVVRKWPFRKSNGRCGTLMSNQNGCGRFYASVCVCLCL